MIETILNVKWDANNKRHHGTLTVKTDDYCVEYQISEATVLWDTRGLFTFETKETPRV